MKFSTAEQAAMLAAIGVNASVNGKSLVVDFTDTQTVAYDNGTVESTPPIAIAATADVLAMVITGGSNGTVITIDGKDFRVHSVEHDGDGFQRLELGTV